MLTMPAFLFMASDIYEHGVLFSQTGIYHKNTTIKNDLPLEIQDLHVNYLQD